MNKIEIEILNPEAAAEAEKIMVCAARLTQHGHKIKNLQDFRDLYNQNYKPKTVLSMANLPHPTIQKFGVINAVVVGASRRFLAQITRHQNEVKFMSASLQYSDYSDEADFTVPYQILTDERKKEIYLEACKNSMEQYKRLAKHSNCSNDSAGYAAPQGLRNVLIISATPYQWKHMIGQRVCRRNTQETRYVMLRIWEALFELAPEMFSRSGTGPFCMKNYGYDGCKEGKMTCGIPIFASMTPTQIIEADFPLLA